MAAPDVWVVSIRGRTDVEKRVEARSARTAFRLADLRGPDGIPLPYSECRVRLSSDSQARRAGMPWQVAKKLDGRGWVVMGYASDAERAIMLGEALSDDPGQIRIKSVDHG